jgi:cell division protein FtsL
MNIDRVLVLAAFGLYTAKLLVLGAQPADAAVVLVLALAHFGNSFYNHQKQVNALEQKIADTNLKIEAQDKVIGELRTAVTGIKMGSSMRSVK